MSGGKWCYKQNDLQSELFGYRYDEMSKVEKSKFARSVNPLGDRDVSELCYDLLDLINNADRYYSGDTTDSEYKKELKAFKKKWLPRTDEAKHKAYKLDLENFYKDLLKEI